MKAKLSTFCILALIFAGCNNSQPDSIRPVSKTVFTGKVQKGPFVEGSSVDIFELAQDFSQTGKVFTTTILDKQGTFEQRDMQLSSQFAELRATGYYFNEVNGKLSESPLTLTAVADISDIDNVNVNILTTLERERIYYLIGKGMNFHNAKNQAHKEVLDIFGMTPKQVEEAEMLDIEDNVQLLVISAIAQGLRPTAEVTQLVANIAFDIASDGKLDNAALASVLKNNAAGIKAATLVKNMQEYDMNCDYKESEVNEWLQSFEANTTYQQTEYITYPEESIYGENVLAEGTEFQVEEYYSFAALTPAWASLFVEITGTEEWHFQVLPDGPINWTKTKFETRGEDENKYNYQKFTVTQPGMLSVLKFKVLVPSRVTFTFYEYGSEPKREKTVIFR